MISAVTRSFIDSEFLNLEARAEYYFGGRSRFNLSGFYKDIDNPIEAIILGGSGTGDLTTTFANAPPEATLYGAGVEFVYGIDLADPGRVSSKPKQFDDDRQLHLHPV